MWKKMHRDLERSFFFRKARKNSDEPLKAKHNPNHSPFILLGFDFGHASRPFQFACSVTMMFLCLIVYGYLQEKLVVERFQRTFGTFITLLQFGGYTLLGFIFLYMQRNPARKIPLKYYAGLAFLQIGAHVLTNLSMIFLNYPAKVFFKSSRVVATVIVGSIVHKKQYPKKDWMVVLLLLIGLTTFIQAEILTSPIFDIRGVALILIAIACAALVLNAQESLLRKYDAHPDEFIFYTYLGSSILMVFLTLCNGEFHEGIVFLHEKGWGVFFEVVIFATAGFMQLSCTSAVTKQFGALISSISTTTCKALTVILSFVFFPKPFVSQHLIGALFFTSGLFLKSWKTNTNMASDRSKCHVAKPKEFSRV